MLKSGNNWITRISRRRGSRYKVMVFIFVLLIVLIKVLSPRMIKYYNIYKMRQIVYQISLQDTSEPLPSSIKDKNIHGEWRYLYEGGQQSQVEGKEIRPNKKLLHDIGYPLKEKDFIVLTPTSVKDFVIVTASSDNHFMESLDAVSSAQNTFPGRKIIYYSLGLKKEHKQKLERICDLELREFNFTKYPPHMKFLKNYSWKPVIDFEVLQEFHGIFWMDSSIRFRQSAVKDLEKVYDFIIGTSNGFALFVNTYHSNYAVTHPDMYKYFPTDLERQKQQPQLESGGMFIYRTKSTYYNILKWLLLCALDPDCWDPRGAKQLCVLRIDLWQQYINCHRYDQAAVNILGLNYFGRQQFFKSPFRIYDANRGGEDSLPLRYC